jgi:hypothetical protein
MGLVRCSGGDVDHYRVQLEKEKDDLEAKAARDRINACQNENDENADFNGMIEIPVSSRRPVF